MADLLCHPNFFGCKDDALNVGINTLNIKKYSRDPYHNYSKAN